MDSNYTMLVHWLLKHRRKTQIPTGAMQRIQWSEVANQAKLSAVPFLTRTTTRSFSWKRTLEN